MRVGLSNEARGGAACVAGPSGREEALPGHDKWHAQLALSFGMRHGKTLLRDARHHGPLRVQRPFYPAADDSCHVYVLHPPGGMASGDELELSVEVGAAARALLTTPGATKLYRSRGFTASLRQHMTVHEGARLEWLPQETILFDGAEAELVTHVHLFPTSVYAGWEIVCLGRPACAETFTRGRLNTELCVRVEGRLRFMERGDFCAGDPVLAEPWGLAGAPVFGLFLVVDPNADGAWVDRVRSEVVPEAGLFSISFVSGIFVARYRGHSTLDARRAFERMFQALRPLYAGRNAVFPRIWQT